MNIKIDPLDRLFSLYIRTRSGWNCERCKKQFSKENRGSLQTSHFHGRRKQSVRFDPENCASLCFLCHRRFTEHPLEHVEWFKKRLGKRFDALTIRANTIGKPDRSLIKIWLDNELKNWII